MIASATINDDLAATGEPRDPPRFNGQRPILQLAAEYFNLSWGLRQFGLPDTRIIFGVNNTVTSFDANRINSTDIRTLGV